MVLVSKTLVVVVGNLLHSDQSGLWPSNMRYVLRLVRLHTP